MYQEIVVYIILAAVATRLTYSMVFKPLRQRLRKPLGATITASGGISCSSKPGGPCQACGLKEACKKS